MPDWSQVSRTHVLQAMEEYDRIGDREFLRRYGFHRSRVYTVWNGGQEYDARAILGAAYFHSTGSPAGAGDFVDGEQGAAQVLKEKGFDIAVNEVEAAAEELRAASRPARSTVTTRPAAKRAAPKRTTADGAAPARATASRPAARKAAAAEPVFTICPTCNMALPASGICDFCD